jgi:molecular chaperone DnaK (HSP70)
MSTMQQQAFSTISQETTASTVVVYSAGYATVPDDLKYAAIKFVQGELSNSARDPSLKRLKIEGVSEREWWVPDNPTKDSIVPPDVMDILRRGGYVNEVLS